MPKTKKTLTFSHLNQKGQANMVDISGKTPTTREAVASGKVYMQPETMMALKSESLPKGDVLATARIAGIQAAKKTSDLIPLCHPLMLSKVKVEFELASDHVLITATCKLVGSTGVEMEALTAVSVAALTLFDMCKSADKSMSVSEIHVVSKVGGKSDVKHH